MKQRLRMWSDVACDLIRKYICIYTQANKERKFKIQETNWRNEILK